MAEDFQATVSGGGWWHPPRTTTFNRSSCSSVVTDMDHLGACWESDLVDMKAKSSDDSSDGSMVFQDTQNPGGTTATFSPDSASQMMVTAFSNSPPTTTNSWNQNSIFRVQEHVNTFSTGGGCGGPTAVTAAEHQGFSMDRQQSLDFITTSGDCTTVPINPTSYGYPSSLLQSLFDSNSPPPPPRPPQQPLYDFQSNSNDFNFISKQVPGDLHLDNNTPFWNASVAGPLDDNISSFFRSPLSQLPYKEKQSCLNVAIKPNFQETPDSSSAVKKSSGEPPFKRPRLETPSPLPTFKVRKEKLGDRITALQQLVSPFGKTDTASVLHEAIEYIKLLHDQVNILSTPYMKNAATMQPQQVCDKVKDAGGTKQNLRSLGLCLVPVSSTFPVATETTSGFWTPSYGGSFR